VRQSSASWRGFPRSVRSGLAALVLAAGLGAAGVAGAATRVLVVSGLGGEAAYEERFAAWSAKVSQASATATGDPERVQRLAGSEATSQAIEAALQGAADTLREGDQFVLVLIGHGSYDGSEYRFNIAGPDITGTRIGELLDRIPAAVSQLVINATSTSGAVAERWARPHRVVVTATRSGGERNATRFAGFWAEALASEEADRDKDGSINAQEAYDFAARKVADSFKTDAAVQTERSRLTGTDPARFVVGRYGAAALFANDAQLSGLREEQNRIESRLGELRAQKAEMAEDAYYDRLEPVLVEMARVGERIDARLAALGVDTGGQSDARR
jgi:hypothetical protein